MKAFLLHTAVAAFSLATTSGLIADFASAQEMNQQVEVGEPIQESVLENLCHLYIKRRAVLFWTPKYTGSAVLFRGRYLLTAGHNVYQDNSSIRSVQVRCGSANARSGAIDEIIEPWQAIDASGYDGDPFSRDFGVIRLNTPIHVAEPFSLASIPAQTGDEIRFAGYPGRPHSQGWNLFAARGSVKNIKDDLAYYDIATFKSNSGGPVWREVDGKPELVAIHVTNSGGRIVDAGYRNEVERLISELDRRASERGN